MDGRGAGIGSSRARFSTHSSATSVASCAHIQVRMRDALFVLFMRATGVPMVQRRLSKGEQNAHCQAKMDIGPH